MIFNVLAATSYMSSAVTEELETYAINREFVRSMLIDFSHDHLIDPDDVLEEISRNDALFDRFIHWLRENRGFGSCNPWSIPSENERNYRSLLGVGFEIKDDDHAFVEWRLTRG